MDSRTPDPDLDGTIDDIHATRDRADLDRYRCAIRGNADFVRGLGDEQPKRSGLRDPSEGRGGREAAGARGDSAGRAQEPTDHGLYV